MRILPPVLRESTARWVYAALIVSTTIAQAILAVAWWDTRHRVSREELVTRQANIAQVEACYRSALTRQPTLAVLDAVEENTLELIRAARARGDTAAVARSSERLGDIRAFRRLTVERVPVTTRDGRVPECELRAAALGVDLELVGRRADGRPQ